MPEQLSPEELDQIPDDDLRLVSRREFRDLERRVAIIEESQHLLHPEAAGHIEWARRRACCNIDRRHLAQRAVAALKQHPGASVSEIAATLQVEVADLEHPAVMCVLRDAVANH